MPRLPLTSVNVSFGVPPPPPAAVDRDGLSGVPSSSFLITCILPAHQEVFTTRMSTESHCHQVNVGKTCTTITTISHTSPAEVAVEAALAAPAAPTPSSNVKRVMPTAFKTPSAKKAMPTAINSSPAPTTIKIASPTLPAMTIPPTA